jgi:thiosulfate dehydrogenase [quinone] large subunit
MATTEVRIRSTVGGLSAESRHHTLRVRFVLALRLMMGIAFFQIGVEKVLSGSFDAAGYLQNAPPSNGSPAADLFVAMGETPWFVEFVNVAVPWGES